MPHMTNTHLREMLPIGGTLNTIVILPAAEAIPHRLDRGVNGGSGPVGVAVVGHHTAKVLKFFVLILDGSLQPIPNRRSNGATQVLPGIPAPRG